MEPGRTASWRWALRRHGLHRCCKLVVVLVATLAACTGSSEGVSSTSGRGPASAGETIDDGVSSYEQPAPEEAPPATEAGPRTPMQTAADVNELLVSWQQNGPADYHYTGHLFFITLEDMIDGPGAECGSGGGPAAVWVTGGMLVEAQFPESACVVDLASPTRPPLSADELFMRTLDLIGDDAFGARVEVNEVGFPTSIFTESRSGVIEFSLKTFEAEAGQPGTATDERARLERARARWQGSAIDSYLIEVERTCRCAPPYRGPFEVSVAAGSVTATVNGAAIPDDLNAASFTVDGLHAAIDDWMRADRLLVIYDDRGIPLRIDADPVSGTADDEVTVTVTRFVPAGTGDVDLEMLLRDLEAAVDDAPADARSLGDATFCGFDDVSLNSEPIGGDPISRACFTSRAARGEPAVLVQRFPTTEGDPIIEVLKVATDGSLTLHADNSQDTFGSGGWQTRSCSQIEPRPEVGANFFTLRC